MNLNWDFVGQMNNEWSDRGLQLLGYPAIGLKDWQLDGGQA